MAGNWISLDSMLQHRWRWRMSGGPGVWAQSGRFSQMLLCLFHCFLIPCFGFLHLYRVALLFLDNLSSAISAVAYHRDLCNSSDSHPTEPDSLNSKPPKSCKPKLQNFYCKTRAEARPCSLFILFTVNTYIGVPRAINVTGYVAYLSPTEKCHILWYVCYVSFCYPRSS